MTVCWNLSKYHSDQKALLMFFYRIYTLNIAGVAKLRLSKPFKKLKNCMGNMRMISREDLFF